MDPVSLAGLGLSTASLAFQLFAGCIKGFILLSTAHNIGRDSSTFLCMLNLQEIQLTEWARSASLLSRDAKLDKRLNETVVHATLKELQDLLLNTEKLKTRYKFGLVAESTTTGEDISRAASPGTHGILSQAISDDLRGEIMYRAQLIHSRNTFPQRLWWAAVDKAKFEELVERIKSFIRELWHLLDPIRQNDVSQTLQLMLSHVITMNGKVDELSSLHETLLSSSNTLVTNFSMPNNKLESLASAAEVKKQIMINTAEEHDKSTFYNTAIHQRLGLAPSNNLLSLNTDHIDQYKPMKNNPDMGIATYKGYKDRHVFIEWKSLPIQFRSKIIERAEDLASLLTAPKHPDFRSLQCIGIARNNDEGKIAFIFKNPSSPNTSQLPQSLRNLFGLSPSVTERIRLALQITQSVKYFHTAGWLHKNLRSENILFWHRNNNNTLALGTGTGTSSPLTDPTLVGFAFSRQDSSSQISEQPSSDPQRDIYRHPDAMGEPSVSFTAAKDIYALGTILLEIGEWRSLRSLVEKVIDISKTDVPTEQLAKVKPFLLDEGSKGGLGMLKFRMGEVYARVTKMMLRGEVPAAMLKGQEGVESVFSPGLLDTAIIELERCIV